jgi:hypothetical protein
MSNMSNGCRWEREHSTRRDIERRLDDQIERMTLREKKEKQRLHSFCWDAARKNPRQQMVYKSYKRKLTWSHEDNAKMYLKAAIESFIHYQLLLEQEHNMMIPDFDNCVFVRFRKIEYACSHLIKKMALGQKLLRRAEKEFYR